MFNPGAAPKAALFPTFAQAAALQCGAELIESLVPDPAEIEEAIAKLADGSDGALIIDQEVFTGLNRDIVTEGAAHHRLPAIYALLEVERGEDAERGGRPQGCAFTLY